MTVEGASEVTGDETNGWTIAFTSGRTYQLDSNGTITPGGQEGETTAKWIDNGDGSWTNLETGDKINIGDVVYYDPTKDANGNTLSTTYTSYGVSNATTDKNNGRTSGCTRDQAFSVSAITNGWRVLGVNERGQIELISADPIETSSGGPYYLNGEIGYLNGTDELNAICKIFGNGKGARSARSLNVDDVDKLAGIKTDADKKACLSSYGDKYKYRFPEDGAYMQYNENTGSGYSDAWKDVTSVDYQTFRMPGAGASTEINKTNRGESQEIINTYYYYVISSKIKQTNISNLLCKGTTSRDINQWLATQCVNATDPRARFGLFGMWKDTFFMPNEGVPHPLYVTLIDMYGSNGEAILDYGFYPHSSVRPVVILKINVKLAGNSIDGWTIQ